MEEKLERWENPEGQTDCCEVVSSRNIRKDKIYPARLPEHELKKDDKNRLVYMDGENPRSLSPTTHSHTKIKSKQNKIKNKARKTKQPYRQQRDFKSGRNRHTK